MNGTLILSIATKLSDNILAYAFELLYGSNWKQNWPNHQKAYEVRTILNGDTSPAVEFPLWLQFIEYLEFQCDLHQNGIRNELAKSLSTKLESLSLDKLKTIEKYLNEE